MHTVDRAVIVLYLIGITLFGGILVWGTILASHMVFRRHHDAASLPVRMPLFPYAQILGLVLIAAIGITMALDTEFWNIAAIVGIPWTVLVALAYLVWRRFKGSQASAG